jgi:ribose 5-phosphate isomerase A
MVSAGSGTPQQPSGVGAAQEIERHKRLAARAAAELVQDGMLVGLGTGSTVAYLLEALGERELGQARFAATSPATELTARALGLEVRELDELGELDLAIDGADQVDPQGWLIKGGGAAHTREKIVAASARRFVVIVSAEKLVGALTPPVPLELISFGVQSTLRRLEQSQLRAQPSAQAGGSSALAPGSELVQRSPDGGLIADYLGPVGDPRELEARLSAVAGVIEHGLFEPEMVSLIISGGEDGVASRAGAKPTTP